jgi:hypothetical protein
MTFKNILSVLALLLGAGILPVSVRAQGQDSAPWERDLQVIAALLPGHYSNANQSYFDRRVGRPVQHQAVEAQISAGNAGADSFDLALTTAGGDPVGRFRLHLRQGGDSRAPGLSVQLLPPSPPEGATSDAPPAPCDLTWRRSAAEFVAEQREPCHAGTIERLVLSEGQLWVALQGRDVARFELHRARDFECYADIPGVGGGRDEPYDRYEGLAVHDQGGSAWFTSREGRRLGVSMLKVDWPINNYEGAFARDSLVVYVSEETSAGREELGYAFTVPEADRIGINLKWMLVNCFMQSNEAITPFM